jgi:PAS domain S-box-containing protein
MLDSCEVPDKNSFFKRSPIIWNLVFTFAVMITLFYSLFSSQRMISNYIPLANSAAQIQIEASLGHLWFEEILSGDTEEDLSIVWQHFEQAEIYAEMMRTGDGLQEETFLLFRGPELQKAIDDIGDILGELHVLSRQRWELRDGSGVGSPLDKKFDSLFFDLLEQGDIVEDAIARSRASDLKKFQAVQRALFLVVLGFSFFSHYFFRRFKRKQDEIYRSLMVNENKTRSTFNALGDAVFIHPLLDDSFGNFVEVNLTACDMYGFTKEEFLSMGVCDVTRHGHLDPPGKKDFLGKLKDNGQLIYESTHATKTGVEFPVEINSTIIDFEGTNMIMAVVRDISDRKMSEDLLRESQENYETLFDESPVSLWVEDFSDLYAYFSELKASGVTDFREFFKTNPDTLELCAQKIKILKVNKAAVALHEAGSKEELLSNLNKTFSEKSYDVFKEELIALADDKVTFESEAEVRTIAGELKNIFLKVSINPKGLGKGMALLATFDITEKSRLEAQFRQAQKMESVGLLAGGVAHDFNNMLAVILGNTELALEEVNEHQPIYGMLDGIKRAGARSADLTKQLLAFARKQAIAPKLLDLNLVVEDTLKMLRRIIGENVELAWIPEAGSHAVKIDPSQVNQILTNLCVNSRDAIAGIGKITIETQFAQLDDAYCNTHPGATPGDYVLLVVSDNGCGMEKAIIDRIYEPFFSTKACGEGSGLGMATVYGIIKQNLGFINTYSEPGVGTAIKIYLPHQDGIVEDYSPTESPTEMATGTETILVVEDEGTILDMSTRMLQKQGYTVLAAPGPNEAIALAREHGSEIHLLLSDVIMPGMSGLDLSTQLQKSLPELRFIFMSGYTANVIAHDGILDEGVNFIQKPFAMHELLAKVRTILDS